MPRERVLMGVSNHGLPPLRAAIRDLGPGRLSRILSI